jgi:protein TonB
MENRAHHWLIALVVAALLHAAVALALVRTPSSEVARIVTIAIELGPGDSGSDGRQPGTGADGDGGEPAGDAAEDARIEQTSDAREPELNPTPDSIAEAEPEPEREQEPEQGPESESTIGPSPIAEVVPPVPKPEPVVVETPAPSPKVAEKPAPQPKVVERPRPSPKPSPKPPTKGASAPRVAGESRTGMGESGLSARGQGSGAGTGKGGGSKSGSSEGQSRYYGKLAAWLARHKRYPAAARRSRQTGTVRVTFTIDRNGRVLSKRIVASSGHSALDQEVEAMLRRASPMPKIPRELGGSTLTVTLPVVFNLR